MIHSWFRFYTYIFILFINMNRAAAGAFIPVSTGSLQNLKYYNHAFY